MNISNIISLPGPQAATFRILCTAEPFREFIETISVAQLIAAAGLVLFAVWIVKTSWGLKALRDSPLRPNSMPPYLPLIVMFAWFMFTPLGLVLANFLMPDLPEWQKDGVANLVHCLSGIAIGGAILFLAKHYFANGLKGFGFDIKTLHKDLAAAVLNLLCVWPLVMAAILLTIRLATAIRPDFEMPQHDQLEMLGKHPQWSLRVLIFVVAAFVAPILEELLFRGLFQTTVRNFLADLGYRQSAWLSIGVSSLLFAAAHADAVHWPALFVLSIGMGYSYEKSGSLFRPILIHAMFNGMNVLAALLSLLKNTNS